MPAALKTPIRPTLFLSLALALFTSSCGDDDEALSKANPGLKAPTENRAFLTLGQLEKSPETPPSPLHFDHFMPIGTSGDAKHRISGQLEVPTFPVQLSAGRADRSDTASFPGFTVPFFSKDGVLIPIEQGILSDDAMARWDIILSPGKVWSEPSDGTWSRAAFPFTLVERTWSGSRNGVATFLFNGETVSQLRVQVGQESAPNEKFDVVGQAAMTYRPGPIAESDTVWRAYKHRTETRIPIRPWTELEARFGDDALENFNGTVNPANITMSGLLVDGSFHTSGCSTRYGPYPFCSEMRHAVYSITKTMGGLLTLARLAKKFGATVMDERILDHVPLRPSHAGWDDVTFGDTLNMATGIGDIVPERVADYVDTDMTPLSLKAGAAQTTIEKLTHISQFDDYPWGPGEVMRYRTVDTFVLSVAMDRLLKRREGEDARLWDMMEAEVFSPLGIGQVPVTHTREPNETARVPHLGIGLLPTYDEALRIALLLHNGGVWNGEQLLHPGLTREAVDNLDQRGLPSGWTYREGGEAHYHMGFWRVPHRAEANCYRHLPGMSGYGGNYIILMPGNVIGVRFADGGYDDPATWDSYGLRQTAHNVRPFCDGESS